MSALMEHYPAFIYTQAMALERTVGFSTCRWSYFNKSILCCKNISARAVYTPNINRLLSQGGSWCNNAIRCIYRKKTSRRSSNHMEKQLVFTGILSKKAEDNPGSLSFICLLNYYSYIFWVFDLFKTCLWSRILSCRFL